MLLAKAQIKAAEIVASVKGKPFIHNLNSQLRGPASSLFFVRDSLFQKSPAGFHCISRGRR